MQTIAFGEQTRKRIVEYNAKCCSYCCGNRKVSYSKWQYVPLFPPRDILRHAEAAYLRIGESDLLHRVNFSENPKFEKISERNGAVE